MSGESKDVKVAGFELFDLLGEGGMGSVHRAWQSEPGRKIALKILSADATTQESLQRRFVREAQIQSELDHPHLVQVFGAGQDAGRHWIAMELIEGGTLAQVIDRRGPLPIDFLLPALRQLASALAFLHEREVVHRDLKPGNVMLSSDGVIKIADFGLARKSGQTALTGAGTMVGTLAYMSPESVSGGEVGGPSDMYALGLMAYEMATGNPPYKGGDMSQWVAAILIQEAPPPSLVRPDVPPGFDELALALVAKDPEVRPTAVELVDRITQLMEAAGKSETALAGIVRELVVGLGEAPEAAPTASWRTMEVKTESASASGAPLPPLPASLPAFAPSPRSRAAAPLYVPPEPEPEPLPESAEPPPDAPEMLEPPFPAEAGLDPAEAPRPTARWPLAVALVGLLAAGGYVAWQSTRPVAADPAVARNVCGRRLAALAELAPELVRHVRQAPALTEAVVRWTKEQTARDRRAMSASADAAEAEARKLATALRAARGAVPGACPERGLYLVKGDDTLACDAHPDIAPLRLSPSAPLDPAERSAVQLALQHILFSSSPALAVCVEQQRRILDAVADREPEVRIPSGVTLADLERDQPAVAVFLHPVGESYSLTGQDPERILECSQHLSVLRLARRTAAFSVVSERR